MQELQAPTNPETILLIDKPVGCSSFDVIRALRRELNIKKMGHAGTLDPLASGLMIIGVGAGTKLLADFLKLPKVYDADILFGYRTDTGDREGDIMEQHTQSVQLREDDIANALTCMVGILSLAPPIYSAIKQDGVPLYKRARRGEHVATPRRDMHVHAAELLQFTASTPYPIARVRFHVASGVYIRSLAEELGRRLGVPATLTDLRRISIGSWRVEDARTITLSHPKPQ